MAETEPRRRIAPPALETSDVTRYRGVLAATLLGALVTLVVAIAGAGSAGLRAPGPQARPHRLAKLECKSCHESDRPAAGACARCHGPMPSLRPAHRALGERGAMSCATCHAIHRADEGVAFLPDGEVVRYGSGWETSLGRARSEFLPKKAVSVPLVPARACLPCHDLARADDPVAACLVAGQARLGVDRPTVCFDEHRAITARAGAGAKIAPGATTERDAAWEAARAIAARGDRPLRSYALPTGSVGLGLLVAFGALGLTQLRVRRRARALARARAPVALVQPSASKRLPTVDTSTCLGCNACVDACPYDVLEVRRFVAVVARPDDCCGLTLCEQRCPNGSLVVREGEPIEGRPRVSESLESADVPGLYLAGDLTGLPLIKNAINQGAAAVRAVAESLERRDSRDGVVDVAIVGAGPAGISAALEAKVLGLTVRVLEQGSVAHSIKSFPRGKLVFDQPLGMPLVGDLWLEECTKEELLGKWLRIVRRAELEIEEGTRVTGVVRREGRFELTVSDRDGARRVVAARRVVLAIGRRGTPRRLEAAIAPEAESHVFHSLADARSFAGERVVVVGLGDSAMETAIALSHQPETSVTIVHRGSGFRRGKTRNIEEVRRLVEHGRIRLLQQAEVARVRADSVEVESPAGRESLPASAVFVMIGSILPWDFLEASGIVSPKRSA